jgi:stage III sporulation protein AH
MNSKKKSESGNQVLEASKTASNFFAQARLDRETSRSKNAELLEGLTKDEKSDKDIKTKAYNDLLKLVSLSEKEAKIESLLKKAGFEEAIVLFADNGGVDVIVKAPQLTTQQVSQICDIVSRHANVNYDKIIVSNKY